jgi:hypothetical protein
LFGIDKAQITGIPSAACLEVTFTTHESNEIVGGIANWVALLLSVDDMAWIEVEKHELENLGDMQNETYTFEVWNSIFQPFPFDTKCGQTLYACLGYDYYVLMSALYMSTGRHTYHTPSIAIDVPFDIIGPWYFTVDWTVPRVFCTVFLCLFLDFWVSRLHFKREILRRRQQRESISLTTE